MRRAARGFTLIEILVVLAIMGVFLSSITFALGRQGRDALDAEGAGLAAWLDVARERSVLDGGVYGVRQGSGGLELVFHHAYRWHRVADVPPWQPDAGTRLSLEVLPEANRGVDGALVMVFFPGGLIADYSRVWLEVEQRRARLAWLTPGGAAPAAVFESS